MTEERLGLFSIHAQFPGDGGAKHVTSEAAHGQSIPDLAAIEQTVTHLAQKIGAEGSVLPTYGRTEDGARPHIEVDEHGMHFVVVERGVEYERITTTDLDTLLWHVFSAATFSLAVRHELHNRAHHEDNRRIMFARQLQLLEMLSPAWAVRERARQDEVLSRHPYVDAGIADSRSTA